MAHRLTIDDLRKILADANHAGVPGDSPITFKCDGGTRDEEPYCDNIKTSFDLLSKDRALVITIS